MKQPSYVRRAVCLALGLVTAVPLTAGAQQSGASGSPELGEIIVTGTRREGVDIAESMRPVDVLDAAVLTQGSATNMNDVLRTSVVSMNVQRFVAQDGSAFIRPFTLRGLPPDQTLVLVNGKRRHRSALVQITNQPLSAGAQGPDLATIPSIAVERVEVLRDGAASQYGSDAIAGVINFQLKRDRDGGTLLARAGSTYEGDGTEYTLQGNLGLPLASDGFFNVSAEYTNADPTSRGVQRPDAQALINGGNSAVPVPAQRWGNVAAEAARGFFNAEVPATDSVRAYAFGNYSWSSGDTEFFWRNPNARPDIFTSVPLTSVPGGPRFTFLTQYPGGFTPLFGTTIKDMSLTAGFRGESTAGLKYDFSASGSDSELEYRISNTVNPSLGPQSPTEFEPGTINQREQQFHADFVYPWSVGDLASPVNVAFGAEWRREEFEITAGDQASWQAGPYARVLDPNTNRFIGLAVGSSGFPGYAPSVAGSNARRNWAAYVDLEGDVTERLTLGVAGRFEDYSDFGNTFNWKVSGRLELTEAIAVRASVNTGFRAPTPGQSNIADVATNIDLVTGGLLLTATRPPDDPISLFYGSQPLEPEESFNVAGGLVFQWGDGYLLTVDYFNIEVDDRIALTSRIPITAADRAAMLAQGINPGDFQSVRFFGNFFDTETEGFDAVLSKDWALADGRLGLTAAANYTKSEVRNVRQPRAGVTVVDRERRIEISDFNPRIRGNLTLNYERGAWSGLVRTNYYGEWTDAVPNATPTAASFDQEFPSEWLVDVELSYAFNDELTVTLGAENVFDEYPDEDLRPGQRNNGIVYPQFSPFGFSGGFYYGRLTYRF
jgi:iron complex outermembrane recepter protein